jgi:cold shock CspA family protein
MFAAVGSSRKDRAFAIDFREEEIFDADRDHQEAGLRPRIWLHRRRRRKEYFFHRTGLDSSFNVDSLAGGERVSFEIEPSQKGPRANRIKLA